MPAWGRTYFRWQRFEYRPLVPGKNQGRIAAAGSGYLSRIDPADNELMLLEPGNGELPAEFPV